jgi:hypothetical protein
MGTCSGWEPVVGSCENINVTSGSIKCREILDRLRKYSLRYWVFGLCPSSGFFLNNNEKHNISETGSVSVLR